MANLTRGMTAKTRLLTSLIFALIIIVIGVFNLIQERDGYLSFRYPKVILIDLTSRLANFLGYWSAVFVIVCACMMLIRHFKTSHNKTYRYSLYIPFLFFGVGSIPQLYPLQDQVHLWYITPILLSASLPLVAKYLLSHKHSMPLLIAFLVISSSLSLFQDFREFTKPRISFTNVVMEGLYGSSREVINIDEKMNFLNQISETSLIGFDCQDGMYAGAGRRFISDDSIFVNWGPERNYPLQSSAIVFGCKKTKANLEEYISRGYRVEKLWEGQEDLKDFILIRK